MTAKRPPTLNNAGGALRAHLAALEKVSPERRLTQALGALDVLEELTETARQLRAGAILELRAPAPGTTRARFTWEAIADLSGRIVSSQRVQQWAEQRAPA